MKWPSETGEVKGDHAKIAQFFGQRSDGGQLPSSSSRHLVDQVVSLCLGDVISKGQSSLQRQKCVGS